MRINYITAWYCVDSECLVSYYVRNCFLINFRSVPDVMLFSNASMRFVMFLFRVHASYLLPTN